jgi:hypothetical protein
MKFPLNLIWTAPPDFRRIALQEIKDSPQESLYEKMTDGERSAYLKEQMKWHAMIWSCKGSALACNLARVCIALVVWDFSMQGRLGPVAKQIASKVVSYFFGGG